MRDMAQWRLSAEGCEETFKYVWETNFKKEDKEPVDAPTVTTPVNTSGFGLFFAPEEDVLEAATASDDKEFQDYQLAPRISADDDPLEWWKANQTRLPTLFPMAKSFLGCPATTAELERVFSKAGKLHDDQRKSVLDVTLEQQLFASFNWKC